MLTYYLLHRSIVGWSYFFFYKRQTTNWTRELGKPFLLKKNVYPLCTVKIRSSPADLGFQVMHFIFPSPQTTTKIFDPLPYLWKSSTCELQNVPWNVVFWSVLTVLHVLQSADGLLDCYCLLLLLFVGFLVNVTFFKPGFLSKYHHWWHVNWNKKN